MAVLRLKKTIQTDPAEAFFGWLAASFVFPAGPKRGQPFELDDFQKEFVRLVLERDGVHPAYRMCLFSVARKNGNGLPR